MSFRVEFSTITGNASGRQSASGSGVPLVEMAPLLRSAVFLAKRLYRRDSNFQYAGAVNLVVGAFGWVVFVIGCGPGEAILGTARYQRRGWVILAAGLGAAHRPSDLWCARLGSTPK